MEDLTEAVTDGVGNPVGYSHQIFSLLKGECEIPLGAMDYEVSHSHSIIWICGQAKVTSMFAGQNRYRTTSEVLMQQMQDC